VIVFRAAGLTGSFTRGFDEAGAGVVVAAAIGVGVTTGAAVTTGTAAIGVGVTTGAALGAIVVGWLGALESLMESFGDE